MRKRTLSRPVFVMPLRSRLREGYASREREPGCSGGKPPGRNEAGPFPTPTLAPDGTMATSSRVFPVPPIDLSDRDYFIALRDGYQGAFISKVYRGRATGTDQFDFARRRSSSDGTFNGVIDISDSPRYFEQAFGE